MPFHNIHDFLMMGCYAPYVWAAYAIFWVSMTGFSVYWFKRLHQEKQC